MTRVLFVCVKNGGKSQMAAGLFRHTAAHDPHQWQIAPAGTKAGSKLNGLSVESLAEVGVDISDQQPGSTQFTPDPVGGALRGATKIIRPDNLGVTNSGTTRSLRRIRYLPARTTRQLSRPLLTA